MLSISKKSDAEIAAELQQNKEYYIKSFSCPNSRGGILYQHYLNNEVTRNDVYVDMIQQIRMAQPDDDIFIYLNNRGGLVDTGIQIINSFDECQGVVHTVVDGIAASIAAIMWLAGHQRTVLNHGSLMLHNFSAGVSGKGHEIMETVMGYNSYILEMFKLYTTPFLTDEEYAKMIDGKDYWFSANQIRERLERIEQQDIKMNLMAERDMLIEQMAEDKKRLKELNFQLGHQTN